MRRRLRERDMDSAGDARRKRERDEKSGGQDETDEDIEGRENRERPRDYRCAATSSRSCRQGSVTTAQFVHSACGSVWGGSNERSLLGRAPSDESRRTGGDLHPLCVISLRY